MRNFFKFYAFALGFALFPCFLMKLSLFSQEATGAYGENGQQLGLQVIGMTNTYVMVL